MNEIFQFKREITLLKCEQENHSDNSEKVKL